MKQIISIIVATLVIHAIPVQGQESTIDQLKFGQHWAGPELKTAKDLKGKVVLVKIWGR